MPRSAATSLVTAACRSSSSDADPRKRSSSACVSPLAPAATSASAAWSDSGESMKLRPSPAALRPTHLAKRRQPVASSPATHAPPRPRPRPQPGEASGISPAGTTTVTFGRAVQGDGRVGGGGAKPQTYWTPTARGRAAQHGADGAAAIVAAACSCASEEEMAAGSAGTQGSSQWLP
jgi:hypothetical protein